MLCSDSDKLLLLLGRIARRPTSHVYLACCYQPSSVICQSVCLSGSHAKTVLPIEMSFGLRTLMGSENHVLDGVQIPP